MKFREIKSTYKKKKKKKNAAKAFNNLNRKVLPRNIKFIFPDIATCVNNCYSVPARLFVSEGPELTSRAGSTQGDPVGMAIYAIRITFMLYMLVAM